MSRRGIFWLMVLFLGFTGIPLVYCILTWSPAEPLRFRITRDLGTGSTGQLVASARPLRELEVEVENIRSVTIQLHGATVWVPDSSVREAPFFGQLDLSSETSGAHAPVSLGRGGSATAAGLMRGARGSGSSIARSPFTVSIPPHRARSFRVHVLEGGSTFSSTHDGELRVRYLCTSQPRHVTSRALTWLRLHLPAIFQPHIPRIIPDENSTTIQLTSTSPPAAPAP